MTEARGLVLVLLLAGCLRAEVRGTVFDGNGAPLSGATVAAGRREVTTALDGTFTIEVLRPKERIVLDVRADDWAPTKVVVRRKTGVERYRADAMLPSMQRVAFDPTLGTTVELGSPGAPVTLSIPPGAVSGESALLRTAWYPATAGPGLLDGVDGGEAVPGLQSGGMFWFDVVAGESDATPLTLSDAVEFKAQPFSLPAPPESEPFSGWQLDDQGRWADPREIGEPEEGPVLEASAFGFWNSDRAYRTACVTGRLRTSGAACAGARVTAAGPDGLASFDQGGRDGAFCVTGAQTWESSLTVGTMTMTVQMPELAGDCSAPQNCADIGDVSVDAAECAAEPPPASTPPGQSCEFTCSDGGCAQASSVCDGSFDCLDGSDEDSSTCDTPSSCCQATQGCPGETGSDCAGSCCCCPQGEACCADWSGCCAVR